MYVVLVYDISQNNNGQRRWSHVFKTCKKYLTHIQNSVFEGEISKVQLVKLQQELKPYIDKGEGRAGEALREPCLQLKPYIDKGEDSVIIFKSRQEKWLDKEFWGKDEDKTSFFL